ncbi:MAG TPA: MBL fold metallo-hydrolase [Chthoniobacteraceae bacterium]|nr:MBL fold metallo-hydrolase [Chthoniobacteraceae bacterium]
MPIPLEDTFSDIIGKALRGLKLSDVDAAARAGIILPALHSLRGGEWDETNARKLAPVLGLGADALAALGNGSTQPAPITVDGLAQFNTQFEDMTVNSYLAWDTQTREAVAFDTGSDCSDLLALIEKEGLTLRFILLTHTHGDHIFDLDRLHTRTGAPAYVSDREPIDGAVCFSVGRTFEVGKLRIETRQTWGHSKGGVTFVIAGLAVPVAVVGDAVFARSMGGGGASYEAALQTNRDEILSLPGETVLCPGHGPLTTVAEEKLHNPFFT